MSHFEQLENMYLSAPINEFYKPSINIAEGTAEIAISVNPQFFHAASALHGSVYFKMLDDAAFFAANSLIEDVFVLTVTFETKLLKPVVEGELLAKGKIIKMDENKIFAEASLYNFDNLVAVGKGIFFKSSIQLNDLSSYKNL